MTRYIKRESFIDAMQFTYPPTDELLKFCGEDLFNLRKARSPNARGEADINTPAGIRTAREGAYIIKDSYGNLDVMTPAVFNNIYEKDE